MSQDDRSSHPVQHEPPEKRRFRLERISFVLSGELKKPFRSDLTHVAVESTCNAYWRIDRLQVAGYPTQMVNTLAVPQKAAAGRAGPTQVEIVDYH